jgi:hypothetical protein
VTFATRIASLVLCLSVVGFPVAAAAADGAEPADPEAALDESLKGFGFMTGLARGCVVPEQRTRLEREALDLAAAIARLFGTDRAFLYASSFGYGTSLQIDLKECAEVLKQYDARVAQFRAGRGGTP